MKPYREQRTLNDLIAERAREAPDRPAYTFLPDGEDTEEKLTSLELLRRSEKLARRLARTFPPGERMLLLYPSGLEFVTAFFACLRAGLIAVPAALPRFRGRVREHAAERLRSIMKDAQPAGILTTTRAAESFPVEGEFADRLLVATDELNAENQSGTSHADHTIALPIVEPDAVCLLQYTSGSTGAPRGVRVTHANLAANGKMGHAHFSTPGEMVMVGWLPLHHDMGLIGMLMQPLFSNGRCIFMSPASFVRHPIRWLRMVSRYGATISTAPNFAYDACVDRVTPEESEGLDLSTWVRALNGAEPVRHEILLRFSERFESNGFAPESFRPCYGLAEATLVVSGGRVGGRTPLPAVHKPASRERAPIQERPAVSCGRVHEDLCLRIVDEQGRVLEPEQVGEIWLRGPSISPGYRHDASPETFNAYLADGEGPYLRTGDLGFLYNDELYIAGRLKDLLIVDGRNIHPQDVEGTVQDAHPEIRSGGVAAFSVENERRERAVLAAELERTSLKVDQQPLKRGIKGTVSAGMGLTLHDVVFVKPGTLPRTTSGKLMRSRARELYLRGQLKVTTAGAMPLSAGGGPAV